MLNFVTFDDRFVVKAISRNQQRVFLRDKLSGYYKRVMDNSFLQHIYGMVKLTIKGQNYRLMILENNPIALISRDSIPVSFKNNGIDLDYILQRVNLKDKFSLDIDLKADFRETLEKDLEYLSKSKVRSCKIVIDILKEPPIGNWRPYSGIYQGRHSYLSVRIVDIYYTRDNTRLRTLSSSGIQIKIDEETISNLRSTIDTYIE